MSSVVLDASALLAVMRKETGYENVLPYIPGALMSLVNLAEVYCVSRMHGSDPNRDELTIRAMHIECVPFDHAQSRIVSAIYPKTLGTSVGLADRICMSLGVLHSLPVLTADRDWLKHDIGIEVRLFRNDTSA